MTLIKLPDVQAALEQFKTAHDNAGALADPAKAQSQAQLAWMEAVTAFIQGQGSPVEAPAASDSPTPEEIAQKAALQLEQDLAAAAAKLASGEGAPSQSPAPESAPADPAAAPTIQPSNAGV